MIAEGVIGRVEAPVLRRARRIVRWLVVIACALALVGLATRAVARRLVFPRVAPTPPPTSARARTFVARDGTTVHALELPGPPGARVVVHFHNNRESVGEAARLAGSLRAFGLGVLIVEYRGYGESAGDPSEEGLYLDAEAALDGLRAEGVGPDRVVLWGTSLGTGVAAEMARRGRGAALVLVTPYTSIPDLATNVVPLLPARLLVADRFETLAKSAAIRVPTLVIHGDADEIVPFWMGERLAAAIAGARLVRVPGGRHGDLFLRAHDQLLAEIAAFSRTG